MEVKSLSDCLNKIDNMIFDKTFKYLVRDDLELIRNHIEWEHADVIAKGEDGLAVMPALTQINHIIERFYSNDTEDELDEQYNKLRQLILEWYEVINTKPKKYFLFQRN